MKFMTSIIGIITAALLLSGCSLEDIFSKLATSSVEEGAKQEYQQAKAVEEKLARINQKKQQYPEFTELKNVAESTKFVAFAFRRTEDKITTIEVEALLANPGSQVYEAWLRGGKDVKEKIRLGALKYNQFDDYSLSFTSETSLTDYSTLYISRETTADETPETIIMTGAFGSKTTASPSAQKK